MLKKIKMEDETKEKVPIDKEVPKDIKADEGEERRSTLSESEINSISKRYHESVLSVREVVHPTSYFETATHVLKANIGAGCFAMGDCLKNSGMLLGPIGLFLVGLMCTYTTHLLLVCASKCKMKWRLPVDPTFSETIELSFKLGPSGFKKASIWAKPLVTVALFFTQLGFCTVYYTVLGNTACVYFNLAGWNVDERLALLIIFPAVMGLCLIRNLKYLAPFSFVANGLILLTIGIVVGMVFWDMPTMEDKHLVNPFERWPLAFGTMIFTYEGINLVIPLRNEMKNPKQFVEVFGVLNVSMAIIISIYILFGIISYWKFGDEVLGNVTANLENGHWSKLVASATIGIALMLSYPLQFYVVLKITLELLANKLENFVNTKKRLLILEICIRILLVTVTFIASISIPYLALFISICGAIFGIWLAAIMPVLSHISLFSPWSRNHKIENLETPSYKTKIWLGFWFNIFILGISALGFFLGAFTTIKELVEKIKEGKKQSCA